MRPSTRPLAALATVVTGIGVGAFALAPAAQADTTTTTFFYSGGEQTLTVPSNVIRLTVEARGGQGGSAQSEPGGVGSITFADIYLPSHTSPTTVYVEVGGDGASADSNPAVSAAGQPNSLDSRLLVAPGGGGAAVGAPGGFGGSPGGAGGSGCASGPGGPGGAGTASAGGPGGSGDSGQADGVGGVQGAGGNGGEAVDGAYGGGGGGGGLYGGGGGGAGPTCGGSGGGGSSYVAPGSTSTTPNYDFGNSGWITISYVAALTPLVTTTPASGIGQTSATLNGVVTPETVTPPDSGALCEFQYSIDTSYSSNTGLKPCGTGMDQLYYSDVATNLLPGTTYNFRLVASNRYGYSYDFTYEQQFTTLSPPPRAPAATTSPATNIGQHVATLVGVVNPEGYATTYHFQYGTTKSYGKNTAKVSAGSGTSDVNVQAALSGLLRHTTYHFRIVAVSVNGTTKGADLTFRTG